jgi:hypothetical protein
MCREIGLWEQLYTTYIRPHLEFAAPVWNLNYQGDIDLLEKVQGRATKVPHALLRYNSETRLTFLKLTMLKERRARGGCIQVFKILSGQDVVNCASPLSTIQPGRGHRMRLAREIVRDCDQRHHFFTNRVVNNWNALSGSIANTPTDIAFKIAKSPTIFSNSIFKNFLD